MEHIISTFIDDELEIDEKIKFVQKIHDDSILKDETLELLHQEKLISSDVVTRVPSIEIKDKKKIFSSIFRPLGLMASTAAAAAVILFLIMSPRESDYSPYRFVIYRPNVNQVEIAGSFNNWKAMPLRKIASSGYWDVVINLSRGEHKFVYILEGNKRVPDPTIITRENDDFGGENSILLMEI